jgi:sarcosine oxidase, subunit beta
MPRIVVGGAGAIGASIAYHLALAGADDVVLLDRDTVGSGATSKAMGGVRQQFSTEAEVRLAQESIRFFEELGAPYFEQVGYLFLATTEAGLAELEKRLRRQRALGVPVGRVDPVFVPGLRVDDVLGAVFCGDDGVADPPAVTRELVRRAAELGVEVREETPVEDVDGDLLVIACGPWSGEVAARYGVELPIQPLCRQLLETDELDLPERLPMVVESETGFHFRRREGGLVLAMTDPVPRWGFEQEVDRSVFDDRVRRLAHRYPPAAGAVISDAWAGLYDMSPDGHPILGPIGEGVYAACGFSGHGFMQSPAVGRAVAEELRGESPSLDLSPYRLERLAGGAAEPGEAVIL